MDLKYRGIASQYCDTEMESKIDISFECEWCDQLADRRQGFLSMFEEVKRVVYSRRLS